MKKERSFRISIFFNVYFLIFFCFSFFCKKKEDIEGIKEEYLIPINLSNTSQTSEEPSIVVDLNGNVHLVWVDEEPDNPEIYYAIKPKGKNWTPPARVTYNGGASRYPCIKIDKNGVIHLVWQQSVFARWVILYTWRNIGDTWAIPETISIYGCSSRPILEVDNDLGLHLFWGEGFSPDYYEYFYAYKPNSLKRNGWQIEHVLTSSIALYKMVVDNKKWVHCVLEIYGESYYIERNPDGRWSDLICLTANTDWHLSCAPDIAIDRNNLVHVVWAEPARRGIAYTMRKENYEWIPFIICYEDTSWRLCCAKIKIRRNNNIHLIWFNLENIGYGCKEGDVWKEKKVLVNVKKISIRGEVVFDIDLEGRLHIIWSGNDTLDYYGRKEIYYVEFKP
ncbi:MAG: hypothetical protein NZ891_04975 [bacterium]|nr:hypothetical protein [bacterium]MDW8164077.1 hypothetical protein [Candidatus Omnitrophota bacterium]